MIASIHQHSPKRSPSIQQIPIIDTQLNSRLSTPNEDIHINQTINNISPQRQHIRQVSNADSVHSVISDLTSKPSPISPIINNDQQRLNLLSNYQQQDDKSTHRAASINSSSRRSSERFPPPPNLESFDSTSNGTVKQHSTSSISNRSSVNDDLREQIITPEVSYQI
jgi:hypothetical protein